MKDRRFHYVDAARGIAVLLVIYGHTFRESMRAAYAWCDFSYVLVYRFHVSLLFLLSGLGYALTLEKNKTLTEWRYLGKKAKALLLPWFSYSVPFATLKTLLISNRLLTKSSRPVQVIIV